MLQQIYGASEEAWIHFAQTLSLQGDLLPVVSDTNAKISAQSTMSALGKTPSCFNGRGEAVGIAGWTQKVATAEEIARWSSDSRLGICLQTRRVRAIDVDIPDAHEADLVWGTLARFYLENVGVLPPKRFRSGSSKFLVLLQCEGDRRKEVIKTKHGIIELLGDGNQCVVAGAHIEKDGVSRSRYDWEEGLPDSVPVMSAEVYDSLIAELREKFGVEKESTTALSLSPTRGQKLHQAVEADPVAQHLIANWNVKGIDRSGQIHLTCPFEETHSDGPGAISSTSYFPALTNGFSSGHFSCLHAHCEHRTDAEFLEAVGYIDPVDAMFEDLTAQGEDAEEGTAPQAEDAPKLKFNFVSAEEFASAKPMRWLVKDLIPAAEFVVLYGASGSGKTFQALDISCAIARGVPWCGRRVEKGRVAMVVAEGAGGFRNRLHGYAIAHGVKLSDIDLIALDGAPRLLSKEDVVDLVKALSGRGVTLVVLDTFARMFNGNENAAQEVSQAVDHCRKLSKALKATVLAIHHTGKSGGGDNGPRGSAVFKDAADAMLEVVRDKDTGKRRLELGKLKDGEDEIDALPFSLDSVIVKFDEYGSPIISCAVDHGGA